MQYNGAFVILVSLSHEIWPCPDNTATLLMSPNFYDLLVTVLTGFWLTEKEIR